MNNTVDYEKLLSATYETLFMTISSTIATFILGIIIGVGLFLTGQGQSLQNKPLYSILAVFVNVFRSIPFIILLVLLLPLTKILVGSIIGAKAALPALIIGTAPFYGRMVELALREVDKGVLEAATAMGANIFTTIRKVLLPEAMPALISGITVTAVSLVGFTAMAGIIGAGGLGSLAYQEGFQRGNEAMTWAATAIILVIVFIIQYFGDYVVKRTDKR